MNSMTSDIFVPGFLRIVVTGVVDATRMLEDSSFKAIGANGKRIRLNGSHVLLKYAVELMNISKRLENIELSAIESLCLSKDNVS